MTALDTGTDELLATLEDGIARVTLNRPHVKNALSDTLSPAMRRLFARLPDEGGVRCVLLTGAGDAFCAGGDVKGMGGRTKREDAPTSFEDVVADQAERQRQLTGALYALPMPTIAALPGPAAGAGLSIALACDLRIAAASAFVTTGFANVGLSGDYGASWFLTQMIGPARTRELLYTGERVGAARCEALGIVNRVVPDDRLHDEAMAMARRLAGGPTVAYGFMKANVDRALREDLPACLAAEAFGTVRSTMTEDHREAVRAFIEKRRPAFRGR